MFRAHVKVKAFLIFSKFVKLLKIIQINLIFRTQKQTFLFLYIKNRAHLNKTTFRCGQFGVVCLRNTLSASTPLGSQLQVLAGWQLNVRLGHLTTVCPSAISAKFPFFCLKLHSGSVTGLHDEISKQFIIFDWLGRVPRTCADKWLTLECKICFLSVQL